ncbi:unnamed protein product [Closterium sp. Yama58-4]|nr:unnamed protein product [Closterium sp. Yama58-4]
MASRLLVSGLPRSLPPLPPGPAPTCVPCVEGRQRAAPHSSEFPPTEAPLQTLHMDVWGPARVRGQGHERYFLLVVDDYSRYTTVFPLRSKGDVTEVLIAWIRAARLQLRESFGSDFPVLRLHSDRGGEFSSDLLRAFCRARGIRQTFTLPDSPQQNGIAERRIGMIMDVARTSMVHAAAPHFLWPFAVRYAAHQINLHPRVSRPETSPALLWTGKVGDASAFRVWGSRAFVRDLSADKLSSRAVPCVFLGFPPDAPGWQFYHPTSRRVLSSQDVTFDESVPYYRLFPYRTASLPPPPLFLTPGPPPVDPLPPQGPAPSGVSQVDAVEPVEVAVDSGAAGGAEPGGAGSGGAATGGAELGGAEPRGAEPGGAAPGGAEPGGAAPGGAEPGGAVSRSTEPEGAGPAREASGGAGPGGSSGASSRRELLSPQELREWFARRWRRAPGAGAAASSGGPAGAGATGGVGAGGATGAGAAEGARVGAAGAGGATGAPGVGAAGAPGAGATGGVGAGGATGAGAAEGAGVGAAGAGGATGAPGVGAAGAPGAGATGGVGAGGATGAGAAEGAGVRAAGAGGTPGAGAPVGGASAVPAGTGGATRPRPYFVPLLEQVLGLPSSLGPAPPLACPPPVQTESQLQPASPLPSPSPYTGPTRGLAERREPASRPASPVRAARTSGRGSRQRPPPVPGTHRMSLRPSTAPLRAPLPSPPASSLPELPDPESDSLRAARPTVTRLLATVVTDPSFESTAASALVAELVDFAACRLDYAASLVAESESVCPPSVGGECALGTDVLEDRQEEFQCLAAASPHLVAMLLAPEGDPDALDIPTPRSYAEAIEGPYSSQWQAAMDAEMASWKSTGTYVDEVPPPGANIVSGMWIFRVKRPPGSPPVFKARYVARGFSQRQGVDYFQTFSPTPKMTTLRVLLHIAAHRDYELHSLDFSTAFLQGSLHEEIWLRRPPGFTGTFPPGTQWSLRRPVYGLRQAPREWHDTLRTTLAALGFAPSTANPSLFLRTDSSLPPFYILVYVDDLVFATADTAGLAYVKSELQKRHTCTDLGELRSYLGLQITQDRAQRTITLTQSHMVQQVLQRFGFTYSSPQATPLSTRHSLSALPSDESVESSGPYPELVGCLMYLMTCTRPDLAYPLSILARYVAPGRHRPEHMAAAKRVLRYLCSTSGMGLVLGGQSSVVLTGHADASWADDQATQRSSQGYTFSLGSGSVSWRSTRSSSVLGSSCEAEIYAGAMAAQELRWLTYLLTDLGEPPRSPPVLYVDNKAMLALCREHRLEHRTKHIALRYFLARELQQRGQLRLAYTLHMDVWGPTRVEGQSRERYFLLVVDDYSHYTTVFPLRSKGEVPAVLIPWIRAVRLQLRERFRTDLPLLRLHSNKGVMEVARTSMIHAAAPHFLWSFVVRYSAHQLNLWPRVSVPETSPTLHWTGEVGDASRFRVWGSRAFVRDTTADKLSSRAIPCVFLGFPPDAHGWQFYHPTSRRVFPSQDVTFDESPVEVTGDSGAARGGTAQAAASGGAEPVGAEPGGAEPGGAEPGGAEPGGAEPGGAEPGGTEPGGAASRGAEHGGASAGGLQGASQQRSPQPAPLSPQQLREWFAMRTRLRSHAAGARDTGAAGAGAAGAGLGDAGAGGAGAGGTGARGAGAGDTGAGGAGAGGADAGGAGTRGTGAGGTGAGSPRAGGTGTGGADPRGTGAGGTAASGAGAVARGTRAGSAGAGAGAPGAGGAGGTGAGGPDAGGARAGDAGAGADATGAGGAAAGSAGAGTTAAGGAGTGGARAGGSVQQRTFFEPSPQLSELPPESVLRQPVSLTKRCEPAFRPVSPVRAVRTARRVPRPRPPPVPGTHTMALRPSSAPQRVPLPSPPASSLPELPNLESDRIHAASPTVTRLLASVVTHPSFESIATSALVAELVDFAAACRLDYATSLVAESESVCPPSVGGECALGTDVLEDRQEDFDSLATAVPHLVAWLLAPEGDPDGLDILTLCSYAEAISGTYVDEVSPPGANIVDGMWIFRVKRPPGSPPVFKARYVARGFSQRQGVDFFQTFNPTPKMTTLRVLLHVAAQRDYELHSLDFSTAFLQGSLHEEIWLRRPPGFTGSFPPGTQWSLQRPVYGLRQAPREWHDTLRTTLAALGFAPSTVNLPSLFLRTDTSMPLFYIFVYVDDLVFATADTEALALVKSEL